MFTKILHILFSVKTDITGLQVQTVKTGNNVTMKCDQNNENNKDNIDLNVAWYKQSLGNVPKLIVRLMVNFAGGRFSVESDGFDLSISETKEKDEGTYFCGKMITHVVEFGSGILLSVQGKQYFVSFLNFTILNPSFNQNSSEDCMEQMIILRWLSIIRSAVLVCVIILFTVPHCVYKFRNKK
uniref:Ig-like domain-containing protein n=1 Tax=Astyanax mexicanus TaxID=7994 RepID=A0A8B9GQS4_ASTMX